MINRAFFGRFYIISISLHSVSPLIQENKLLWDLEIF